MKNLFKEFTKILVPELGTKIASEFVNSLVRTTNGSIVKSEEIYFQLGLVWAPLIRGWAEWVNKKANYQPYIVLRDAKPLTKIALAKNWPQIWLNRTICGIEDELSGDTEKNIDPLVQLYIVQNGLDSPFTLVDSGCWGTIVKKLHGQLNLDFQSLFFYSHNPYIPGYLNSFDIPNNIMETLNDSLECCFPNYYSRPLALKVREGISCPIIYPLDGLSARLGRAAMNGIEVGSENFSITAEDSLNELISSCYRSQKGEFTGILPDHTPTWSNGAKFIDSWYA